MTTGIWDGQGGFTPLPADTIVRCNQTGHNYGPHTVTDHCGIGSIDHTARYCQHETFTFNFCNGCGLHRDSIKPGSLIIQTKGI